MSPRRLVATVALASSLLLSTLVGSTPAQAQDNGASRTPPMGWSSWSAIR
ncbi:hypothetical protein G3I76_48260, partial [Streptomyces sp. SID11233]|nr:hypothetical protein [Streptomyces sp. SID11233]